MRIWIQILIKVVEICYHTDLPGLYFEPSGLLYESVYGHLWFHFELLKLLNFDIYADLDPAFLSNAELDLASKNIADPDPQPCCRIRICIDFFGKFYVRIRFQKQRN
jgi:hypothetical protein